MQIKMDEIIRKTIAVAVILTCLLSLTPLLFAEDFPAGYLGAGYREYLSQKKQDGYFVEQFTHIDLRQKERVNKRNQIEEVLGYSYQAAPVAAYGILATQAQHKYNADVLKSEVAQQRQERERVASTNIESGFTYIPYSDGKTEYFKDGLVIRIENERVVDELGNVSIKNTYDMQYNNKRLLTSYEATLKDSLGNITKLSWYGVTYSDDSVFYGGFKTNANKNMTEYYLKEIDPAGNVKLTHWKALSYEGKLLHAFSQTINDSVYGNVSFTRSQITYAGNDPTQMTSYHEEGTGADNLAYTLDRTNIGYNGKGQVTRYHEEMFTTQLDGTKVKTTTDAQLKYLEPAHKFGPDVEPDPDRLLETTITTTTENPADGSHKTSTDISTYHYNASGQLIGTSGTSQFSGREAKWYEYQDRAGHILSRKVDKNGEVTYSYLDPETLKTITVSADQVTDTLKDGKEFKGIQTSEVRFENTFGRPMAKEGTYVTIYFNPEDDAILRVEISTITYNNGLVNNLAKILDSQEHIEISSPVEDPNGSYIQTQDIFTAYEYDAKGNLIGAQGAGTGSGWEYSSEKGWYGKYTSIIIIDYEVILGKALRTKYQEDKDYE